jgi:murein L,D-transpeptidase YafK
MIALRRVLSFAAVLSLGVATALTSAAEPAPPKKAARILVKKSEHTMQLLGADGELLATYKVSLGPGGAGHKRREGDMVTPVGRYHVTMRQPSVFKIFLRLDYPNAEDRARFERLKKAGELPRGATIGGDIGIHGGTPPAAKERDWTLGCVAVEDDEIVAIARLVPDGTIVDIDD